MAELRPRIAFETKKPGYSNSALANMLGEILDGGVLLRSLRGYGRGTGLRLVALPSMYQAQGRSVSTPLMFEMTHPADDARMKAVLGLLRASDGFTNEADVIAAAWKNFVETMDYRATPEYAQCYPSPQIAGMVYAAKEGVSRTGIQLARGIGDGRIRTLLNEAWKNFWASPATYQTWENERVANLRAVSGE